MAIISMCLFHAESLNKVKHPSSEQVVSIRV